VRGTEESANLARDAVHNGCWAGKRRGFFRSGLQWTSSAAELVFPVFHRNRTKIPKIQSFWVPATTRSPRNQHSFSLEAGEVIPDTLEYTFRAPFQLLRVAVPGIRCLQRVKSAPEAGKVVPDTLEYTFRAPFQLFRAAEFGIRGVQRAGVRTGSYSSTSLSLTRCEAAPRWSVTPIARHPGIYASVDEPTEHHTPSKPRVMGYSSDARLADYSIPLASTIIYQHRSTSWKGKLNAYSRRSENRPGKGGIRIDRLRRSGMRSRLRQPSSELAAKAPYSWYQQHCRIPGKLRKDAVPCRSAGTG